MPAEQPHGSKCFQVTPETQRVLDDILKLYGSFQKFEEHTKAQEKLREFDWKGLNNGALEAKYASADDSVYQ